MTKPLPPLHPGEVLREEFMEPYGLSAGAVAKACRVPRTRIERIASEKTGITTDTALRLEKLFGASAAFWLGLQADYDMAVTRDAIATEIKAIQTMPSGKAFKSVALEVADERSEDLLAVSMIDEM